MKSDIAIIGGGFAGAMLAVQLTRQAKRPLSVTLYDASGAFARGVAYSTQSMRHLLNVPAGKMGAFPDALGDFLRWLGESGIEGGADDFMPRMIYGDYIASLFEQACCNKQVTIKTRKAEVTRLMPASQGLALTVADEQHEAAHVVLAMGNLPCRHPQGASDLTHRERYTGNVWKPSEGSILTNLNNSESDAPILIIGTGLTMIDMVLSLREKGYDGKIIAVSRNGLLPQLHDLSAAAHPKFLAPESAPLTALSLLTAIHRECKKGNWRGAVDALRPDTQTLWAALPDHEKCKLTRVLTFWNVHRHRMPPQSAAAMQREIEAESLTVIAASVLEVSDAAEGLAVRVHERGREKRILHVAHVLNCMGPGMDIRRSGSPLLDRAFEAGLLQPGPLGWGIAADAEGQVRGMVSERLFAIGPLLTGERLETVAVPELRQQAEHLAHTLLARFQ